MTTQTDRIRELNDRFRQQFPSDGRRYITDGIFAFSNEERDEILAAGRAFDAFDEANDPHGERDFGALDYKGERVFWKIDYYDAACQSGSPDPSDPAQTTRVLTIMLAEEY